MNTRNKILKFFRYLILAACFSGGFIQAQQHFPYQAVIRNAEGKQLVKQPVKMRISILEGSEQGMVLFQEVHLLETNEWGIIHLLVGNGIGGENLENINWAQGSFFLKVEADPSGGDNYVLAGIAELQSVPFAQYAFSGN